MGQRRAVELFWLGSRQISSVLKMMRKVFSGGDEMHETHMCRVYIPIYIIRLYHSCPYSYSHQITIVFLTTPPSLFHTHTYYQFIQYPSYPPCSFFHIMHLPYPFSNSTILPISLTVSSFLPFVFITHEPIRTSLHNSLHF